MKLLLIFFIDKAAELGSIHFHVIMIPKLFVWLYSERRGIRKL